MASKTEKTSWKTDARLQRILKQNAERRDQERFKNRSPWWIAADVVCAVGVLGFVVCWLAFGIISTLFWVFMGFIGGTILKELL